MGLTTVLEPGEALRIGESVVRFVIRSGDKQRRIRLEITAPKEIKIEKIDRNRAQEGVTTDKGGPSHGSY